LMRKSNKGLTEQGNLLIRKSKFWYMLITWLSNDSQKNEVNYTKGDKMQNLQVSGANSRVAKNY